MRQFEGNEIGGFVCIIHAVGVCISMCMKVFLSTFNLANVFALKVCLCDVSVGKGRIMKEKAW